jgi:hypothetical protein
MAVGGFGILVWFQEFGFYALVLKQAESAGSPEF